MIDWTQCDAVERDFENADGAWVFRGTRIPVTALFENLESRASIDDFLSKFPGVAKEQVAAVLKYEAEGKMRKYQARRIKISPPDLNLEHWVCFECRKMFKRPFRLENDGVDPKAPARPYVCSQCREPMINMGLYFEPPRQDELASWKRMRLLADFGYFFYSEGAKSYIDNFILGTPPSSVRELRRRLVLERVKSAESLHLRHASYLKEVKRENARLRRLK
ncbi:MAG TPA: DUF433 domain-containing protein [Blastocatellia bacterium]|nr:DUF433 domain-containing protein [Blastocatellia bacterium]